MAQNNLLLTFEECDLIPRRHFGIALAIANVAGNVIPLFDFAIDQIGAEIVLADVVQQTSCVIRLHSFQHDKRITGKANVHKRLLRARPKAAYRRQYDVLAAALNLLREGLIQSFGAIPPPTGSHPYGKARNRRHELGEARLAHGVESSNVLNARHAYFPARMVSISRCSVRSVA